MIDCFLREIRDMHQLRKDIRSLPPAKAQEFMKRLGDDAAAMRAEPISLLYEKGRVLHRLGLD